MRKIFNPTQRIVALALAVTNIAALATTVQENALLQAPMPHQAYGQGAQVKVHRVSLQGHNASKSENDAALARLRDEVRACAAVLAKSGKQAKPVEAWPDYMMALRDDYYFAANRSIHYASGVTYVVHPADCSLLSEPTRRASLASAAGVCEIDLVKKTAFGNCPADGYANAPAGAVTAGHAALPAALAAYSHQKAGVQRTILGIRCEVWNASAMLGGGQFCTATGGSFTPSLTAGNQEYMGLPLDVESPGRTLSAVDAQLDAMVGAAVFTPYKAAGFTLGGKGGAK